MIAGADAKGLVEAENKIRQVEMDLRGRPFMQAMQQATLIVMADARRLAPVDQGRLKQSITAGLRREGDALLGVVGSNVIHAPFMEMGTGTFAGKSPHYPPWQALMGWAERHGAGRKRRGRQSVNDDGIDASATKAVEQAAKRIAYFIFLRGGLMDKRYLQRAFEKNETRIVRILGTAVSGIVSK
jgi:hypothetical protein